MIDYGFAVKVKFIKKNGDIFKYDELFDMTYSEAVLAAFEFSKMLDKPIADIDMLKDVVFALIYISENNCPIHCFNVNFIEHKCTLHFLFRKDVEK